MSNQPFVMFLCKVKINCSNWKDNTVETFLGDFTIPCHLKEKNMQSFRKEADWRALAKQFHNNTIIKHKNSTVNLICAAPKTNFSSNNLSYSTTDTGQIQYILCTSPNHQYKYDIA